MGALLVYKSFRYRVYPTRAQVARLRAWEDALRYLWNLALEQRLLARARPRGEWKNYSAFDQQLELTDLRASLDWLAEVPRDVCNSLLVNLDRAWKRFFSGVARPPKFKRKGRDAISFRVPSPKSYRLRSDGRISFAKLGAFRCVMHRPIEGTPKNCTLLREHDEWFVAIQCAVVMPDPPKRFEPTVAIDRGITHLVADSDGRLVVNPRTRRKTQRTIARAQRVMARRKKGSNNRAKARLRLARLHRKAQRQRDHLLHVLSHDYAKSHGTVVIEKLHTRAMMKAGPNLTTGILDSGWAKFATMIRYKVAASGGRLVEVPAHYTSQECSACSVVDAKSRQGESFVCTSCGYRDHSDLNAAKVLKARANRSCLPTEASGLPSRRSGKVKPRIPRRPQTPAP